jgi:hypothetical protein
LYTGISKPVESYTVTSVVVAKDDGPGRLEEAINAAVNVVATHP